jgi:hypothetical protein
MDAPGGRKPVAPTQVLTIDKCHGCKITQNKSVSSTEEIQFLDVSTQTDAPRRE